MGIDGNVQIANHCGVAHSFVAKLRKSLATVASDHFPNRIYKDRWGNTTGMHTSGLSRAEAEQVAWQCVLGETPEQAPRTPVPVHRGDER